MHAPMQGHKAWVLCVAWSPDAAQIATGDMAGVLWLWNPATGKPHGSCKGVTPGFQVKQTVYL